MSNYLLVNIYRSGDIDCSNNSISNNPHAICVVPCPNGNISDEDIQKAKYTVLELNESGGREFFTVRGVSKRTMNGGCFVYTTDSRFSKQYGSNPIRLHDRVE